MENTIKRLNHVLSDLIVLNQKVRQCHWNVEGPGFFDYHEFFEELYEFLVEEIDDFAERIRALRSYPVATFAKILETSSLKERENIPSNEMLSELLGDLEHFTSELNTWIDEEDDSVSEDMYIGLTRELEKKAWMLRSMQKSGIQG